MVRKNKVIVLTARTGTGKSTQVPFYLSYDFRLRKLLKLPYNTPIICSQPRKISNVSATNRACSEFGLEINKDVISIIGQNQEIRDRSGKVMYINEHALLVYLINNHSLNRYVPAP
eukprot:TRINITY_DN11105_c0_g1_i1.p1 TRINITY_DN11105_c0_g1~~TRINITY_DN11105_c0_g1_i1.p1  ORF type:complete len:116 (-),score=12.39 TRINITY_DN11105_c0_g1_i1:326-673(-)